MTFKLLSQRDRESLKSYIDKLPDKHYSAEVKVLREQRSMDQNRLYWLWLNCIMDETGTHRDELHEFFKAKYLGVSEKSTFGFVYYIPNTTTTKDTKEFTDYLNRVQEFANVELGIVLPNPEDLHWQEFYNHYKNYI